MLFKHTRLVFGAPRASAMTGILLTLLSGPAMSQTMQMGKLKKAHSFTSDMGHIMLKMDHDMLAAPVTGNPDHDFASAMIPHHQSALDMAKVELLYGKDPVMRRLAQEIVATQAEEIKLLHRRISQMAGAIIGTSPGRPLSFSTGRQSRDRVYTADQVSNTVSVIDPGSNTLLGVIRLGDPVPGALSPLYRGQLLVHGLGYSPDGKTLVAVASGSNSLTFIDTATNLVKGVVYVGRAPHEAFFTPNGKEVWCAVRGENYISVIDPVKLTEKRRIVTTNGPAMVLFSPDGRYAYVPSSFVSELCVVDTSRYKVIARRKQFSPFSPNLAVSRDGKEVWITLKDTGRTQVYSGVPPFNLLATLNTGPISNHVTTIDNASGHFAYISVGGLNLVKVYRRGRVPVLVASIPTGDLPHGIWGSPDGSRVYVGLENGGGVEAIDTLSNRVVAQVQVGQLPQALVYVPNAVPSGDGKLNLTPLGAAGLAAHLRLTGEHATGNVVVDSLGLVDTIQLAASGLSPGNSYELQLVSGPADPTAAPIPLLRFKANPAGAAFPQTIGPVRAAVTSSSVTGPACRYLRVIETKSGVVVLQQAASSDETAGKHDAD
jgi:YVTN family beta-propeller protein